MYSVEMFLYFVDLKMWILLVIKLEVYIIDYIGKLKDIEFGR